MPHNETEEYKKDIGLERIVFFSDAVVAIAITLMAIEIRIPENISSIALPRALSELSPLFISYLISFYVISLNWISHHRMFKYIIRHDGVLIWLNLILLLFISLVPFATSLLGRFPGEFVSVAIYAAVVALLGIVKAGLWRYATNKKRLVSSELDEQTIKRNTWVILCPSFVFLISIVIAKFSPSMAMYFWLTIIPLISILSRKKG